MPEDTRSVEGGDTTDVDPGMAAHRPHEDPRPAAVMFATTEHFTLEARGRPRSPSRLAARACFLCPCPAAWWRWH